MTEDNEILEALRRAEASRRGYADFDSWPDASVRDKGIAQDFALALSSTFDTTLPELRVVPRGSDPPDLVGTDIGIELTELVDSKSVSAAVIQKRMGVVPNQHREWSGEQFLGRLVEIVRRKDSGKPKVHKHLADYWLVIHTDEPALTPARVGAYLEGWVSLRTRLLTRCFLLMSDFPAQGGRPLFELAVVRERAGS